MMLNVKWLSCNNGIILVLATRVEFTVALYPYRASSRTLWDQDNDILYRAPDAMMIIAAIKQPVKAGDMIRKQR